MRAINVTTTPENVGTAFVTVYWMRYKCNILFTLKCSFLCLCNKSHPATLHHAPRGVVFFMQRGGLADVSFLSPFQGKLSLVCQHKSEKLIRACICSQFNESIAVFYTSVSWTLHFCRQLKRPAERGATCSSLRERVRHTWLAVFLYLGHLTIRQDCLIVVDCRIGYTFHFAILVHTGLFCSSSVLM